MRPTFKTLLLLPLVLLCSVQALAGARSVGGSVGVGYLPMGEWQDFVGSNYEADEVGLYGEIFARAELSHHHALSISVERISEAGSMETANLDQKWDFTAIPINVSYEFGFEGWSNATTPFLGVGVGVYHSRVEGRASSPLFPPIEGERTGWGIGLHGYLGQRVGVTQSLAASLKVRGRWADGMYFTQDEADIRVEFSGIDLTAAVEWVF